LGNEAFKRAVFLGLGPWSPFDNLNIGVRIFADEAEVLAQAPEPGTLLLLAAGLAGLAARRFRAQR
jgi:hypothetical protein